MSEWIKGTLLSGFRCDRVNSGGGSNLDSDNLISCSHIKIAMCGKHQDLCASFDF